MTTFDPTDLPEDGTEENTGDNTGDDAPKPTDTGRNDGDAAENASP